MKAEQRIEYAYARRAPVEEVDIRGLKEEADQAVALLREIAEDLAVWLPEDALTKPMVGLDLVEWLKRTKKYLEGGDETSSD